MLFISNTKMMKKTLLFLFCLLCVACVADNVYTTAMLNGTQWIHRDKRGNDDILEFSLTEMTRKFVLQNYSDTIVAEFPYYLTDSIVTAFDYTLVGHSNTGLYVTFYNDAVRDVFSYRITNMNEDSLVFFIEAKEHYVGAADHSIVYTRVR